MDDRSTQEYPRATQARLLADLERLNASEVDPSATGSAHDAKKDARARPAADHRSRRTQVDHCFGDGTRRPARPADHCRDGHLDPEDLEELATDRVSVQANHLDGWSVIGVAAGTDQTKPGCAIVRRQGYKP